MKIGDLVRTNLGVGIVLGILDDMRITEVLYTSGMFLFEPTEELEVLNEVA